MNELCTCPIASFCTRHQMTKGEIRFNKCKGTEESKDCGLAYWQAWERGELGATAPADPVLFPKGFCNDKIKPKAPDSDKSSVGTNLHAIIFRETGVEIPCDECKQRIFALNQMDSIEVESKRAEIINDIALRAEKQAPKLWQKIAVAVDNLLHTGIAKKTIDGWLTEAIAMEPPPQPAEPEPVKKKDHVVRKAQGAIGTLFNTLVNNLLRRSRQRFGSPITKEMDSWGENGCKERLAHISASLSSSEPIKVAIATYNDINKTNLNEKDGLKRLLDHALEGNKDLPDDLVAPLGGAKPYLGRPFESRDFPQRFISSKQFQDDVLTLLGQIPSDVTAIVGIARSGVSVASQLAMYLHLPLYILRPGEDIIGASNGWRLSKRSDPVKEGRALVVDDTVMSGKSLIDAKPIVGEHFKNAIYGAVYVNPLSSFLPDIWAVDLYWPHLLEWNLFNSILSTSLVLDFDGILCQDCPILDDDDGPRYSKFLKEAVPLYLPRKEPIPLIVTARLEKYRIPTVSWLNRYGVKFDKLIMFEDGERTEPNVAMFKSKHYKEWASAHSPKYELPFFIESNDYIAKLIAMDSKLSVICPQTAKIYTQ